MATPLDPSSSSEMIEAAEEAADVPKLLEIIQTCTSHGGDDDWTEAAEESLDALFRLAKGGATPVMGGGMSTLFGSLSAWKEEDAIVEVALGCIVAILSKSYTVTADDVERVDASLLWTILKDFPDESTIQEQACLALEGLSLASPKWKEALLKAVAVDDVATELKAARERITNERNKAYAGRAAEALGVSSSLK